MKVLVLNCGSSSVKFKLIETEVAREELSPPEVTALLNRHSGLLGISGVSGDMRKLPEAEAAGHERARLAIDVFCRIVSGLAPA